MTQTNPEPTFNLWSEAWITLERFDGPPVRAGIEQVLLEAHQYTAIYDLSPLVVASIHRLLVAILQASLDPCQKSDLKNLWRDGRFPAAKIKEFGDKYATKFDIFSKDQPFLQSGDLPLTPAKGDKIETVSRLTTETSPLTSIDHYRHNEESREYFCPACLAAGLVTIPSFTGIGGRGYKTSINGTPPLYVLPVGRNLFENLALSLLPHTENDWPPSASRERDLAWWEHPTVVERNNEVIEVGYLHSLTFPARQIRLHPVKLDLNCTRCGQASKWGAKTMSFEMGECRPKDSAPWVDPFVAYHLPNEGKTGNPWPVLPDGSKALWREFAGLFLYPPHEGRNRIRRPFILERIANEIDYIDITASLQFRCIGVEASQAKVLEWIDASFGVPPSLMNDEDVSYRVRNATQFAEECAKIISGVFGSAANSSRRSERNKVLKNQMLGHYWRTLAEPFRFFVLSLVEKEGRLKSVEQWASEVTKKSQSAFDDTITQVGDDAVSLRQQEKGKQDCRIKLSKKRKRYLEGEGVAT